MTGRMMGYVNRQSRVAAAGRTKPYRVRVSLQGDPDEDKVAVGGLRADVDRGDYAFWVGILPA